MNAERLHAVIRSLQTEIGEHGLVNLMRQLVNNLRSLAQGTNPTTQSNFASARDALYAALTETKSDNFSPGWRQILREMGAEDLFGRNLKEKVQKLLDDNIATPAVALPELEQIHKQLEKFSVAIEQCISALKLFNIGNETLAPGECEIGILIPRKAVKNHLVEFTAELKTWKFILDAFSEVATGSPDNLEIRTLSSSDLLVYLAANSELGACLAKAVAWVITTYKAVLEIRKLHQDAKKQGLPEETTNAIKKHASEHMAKGIEKESIAIVAEFYRGRDDGRRNELVIKVSKSLTGMAKKIDHGFSVEVRVGELTDGETDEKVKRNVAAIEAETPKMQYMKLEGEPILALPESTEEADFPAPKPPRKPRRAKKSAQSKSEAHILQDDPPRKPRPDAL